MKLFVQICALNESDAIGAVIASVREASYPPGCALAIVVVNDGSTDDTAEVARAAGADVVVAHVQRRGLARAFQTGIDACLDRGADIIVNIDADGQYAGADVPRLIAPILEQRAELVIGDRQVGRLAHFSANKRFLQRFGSWVVQQAAGIRVADAVSGFRAYSREAALRLFVTARFSYTVETLIQAGKHGLAVASVPIEARETLRPSRLHRGSVDFVLRQALILLRTYATYEPLTLFISLAAPFLVVALGLLGRLVWIFVRSGALVGHVQSLVLGIVSLMIGLSLSGVGVVGDRILEMRRMIEETLYRQRRG